MAGVAFRILFNTCSLLVIYCRLVLFGRFGSCCCVAIGLKKQHLCKSIILNTNRLTAGGFRRKSAVHLSCDAAPPNHLRVSIHLESIKLGESDVSHLRKSIETQD